MAASLRREDLREATTTTTESARVTSGSAKKKKRGAESRLSEKETREEARPSLSPPLVFPPGYMKVRQAAGGNKAAGSGLMGGGPNIFSTAIAASLCLCVSACVCV